MYNWSTDEKKFKKKDPKGYRLWRLTQLINYGLDGEKLDKKELLSAWPKIKESLDPYKKRVLEFFLWQKQSLLPNNLSFWNSSEVCKGVALF